MVFQPSGMHRLASSQIQRCFVEAPIPDLAEALELLKMAKMMQGMLCTQVVENGKDSAGLADAGKLLKMAKMMACSCTRGVENGKDDAGLAHFLKLMKMAKMMHRCQGLLILGVSAHVECTDACKKLPHIRTSVNDRPDELKVSKTS